MQWFKTFWLTSEEREILRKGKEQKYTATDDQVNVLQGRPYKNIFYSNKNLTVVFRDGTMLSKSDVQSDIFQKVRDSHTQQEIEDLLIVKEEEVKGSHVETKEERKLVSDNLDILKDNRDFIIKGNEVYLKGVNLSMPASVIASFIELEEKKLYPISTRMEGDKRMEEIQALKMFWLKLALNSLPQSREDLLVFVRKNDVKITRNGNLILYRRIISKTGADTRLVTFVTQNYYNIKKSGLDPREFAIAKNMDGYILIDLEKYVPNDDPNEAKPFCNLQQMYLELPTYDTNAFTSYHDKNVEIKLGGVYRIPDDKINLDNGICAAGGLHAAAVDYNYSGFGDMPVVVLVNPSKAITVPKGETGKLRTTEMFVACINDKPIGTHFDESALAAFDSEYHDLTLGELEEAAKNKSFENLSVQENVPAVSLVDLNVIREMLKNRVKQVL